MYHEAKTRFWRWLLALCAAAILTVLCVSVWHRAVADLAAQSANSVKDAVLRSAVQCYAVEGVYPSDLRYLEDNYGLILNEDCYIVTYDIFGSNILPEVSVLVK